MTVHNDELLLVLILRMQGTRLFESWYCYFLAVSAGKLVNFFGPQVPPLSNGDDSIDLAQLVN